MLTSSQLNKMPKVEYYFTRGRVLGRVVACKKPFYRGNGVYHLTMDAKDWEVQAGGELTTEQLHELMEDIRNEKVALLKESVRLNSGLGYELVEKPRWVFQLVKR